MGSELTTGMIHADAIMQLFQLKLQLASWTNKLQTVSLSTFLLLLSLSPSLARLHTHTDTDRVSSLSMPRGLCPAETITCHLVWWLRSHLAGSCMTGRKTKHFWRCRSSFVGNFKLYQALKIKYQIFNHAPLQRSLSIHVNPPDGISRHSILLGSAVVLL